MFAEWTLKGTRKWVKCIILQQAACQPVPRCGWSLMPSHLPKESPVMSPRGRAAATRLDVNSQSTFQGKLGRAGRARSILSGRKAETTTTGTVHCVRGQHLQRVLRVCDAWWDSPLWEQKHTVWPLCVPRELRENDGLIDLFIGPFICFAQSDGWIQQREKERRDNHICRMVCQLQSGWASIPLLAWKITFLSKPHLILHWENIFSNPH